MATVEELKAHGSWTGKTHVQKSIFLLQAAATMDVPFQFVLYKHGPYSFELEAEMEQMMSYDAISASSVPGYGVMLNASNNQSVIKRAVTISAHDLSAIKDVCTFVGTRQVSELERLATAAWIRTHDGIKTREAVAVRLHSLKPHISLEDAMLADDTLTASKLVSRS